MCGKIEVGSGCLRYCFSSVKGVCGQEKSNTPFILKGGDTTEVLNEVCWLNDVLKVAIVVVVVELGESSSVILL
jgi:hypothetical protein